MADLSRIYTLGQLYTIMQEVIDTENEDEAPRDTQIHTDHAKVAESVHSAAENRSAASESSPLSTTLSSSLSLKSVGEIVSDVDELTRPIKNLNVGENRIVQQNEETHTISPTKPLSQKKRNVGIKNVGIKNVGIKNVGIKDKDVGIKKDNKCNILFDEILNFPGQRASFYAEKMNLTSKNLERAFKTLKNSSKIEYKGSNKTGGYHVVI